MPIETIDVLKIWANAQVLVADNTSLLMKYNHDGVISDLCSARMQVHSVAEEMLLGLKGREDLPPILLSFFKAEEDKGCSNCWLSSRIKEHEDCDNKIKRYFETRENLLLISQLLR